MFKMENFSRELEILSNNQMKIQNLKISEIKNSTD